ncbi:hypothetical protein [Aliiroseovarius crassostreae]|uniref:hypothetical protein n=1 Tax=Aliiroseovarius crassostreae TaxID=154981 RepID=UPI001113399C|nr:hypothetical protein [Aliiroseovarius crassostreae]
MSGDNIDGVDYLNAERASLEVMQAQMQGFLRKRLAMWAIRWGIGMPVAFAVPAIWGLWPWLPMAAGIVALVSLATIMIMWLVLLRKFRSTQASADRLEQVLREEDDLA